MFYFHILDLNVNEWVPVKGCILGIWIDEPCVVITTSVETLDVLWLDCFIGCMLGRTPRTKETLPNFCKIWISINGTQQCGIGSTEIHKNSAS